MLVEDLMHLVILRIAKWASLSKEFDSSSFDGALHNWGATMFCRAPKSRKVLRWTSPPMGVQKFTVDGAARGNPCPSGIGGVPQNSEWDMAMLSKSVGILDSDEVEVLAILEALRNILMCSHAFLVVERHSLKVVSWVSSPSAAPWKFHIHFNEIKFLASSIQVEFKH